MTNDSNSVRKEQSFEIALSEYKGKVTGYSCSEFFVNDTLYYIVKRVKGVIDGDICEVTDDEIVAYNFRGKLDKGVKVTSTFKRNKADSTWYLDGTWKTNVTKKYYAVTGKVSLAEEKDLSLSKVFPHLEELNLADEVAFYKERKQEPVIVKIARPETANTRLTPAPVPADASGTIAVAKPTLQKAEADVTVVSSIQADIIASGINKPADELAKTKTRLPVAASSVLPAPARPAVQRSEADVSIVGSVQAEAVMNGIEKPVNDLAKTTTRPLSSTDDVVKPALTTNTAIVKVNKQAATSPASTTPVANNNTVSNKPSQPAAKTNPPVAKPVDTKSAVTANNNPVKEAKPVANTNVVTNQPASATVPVNQADVAKKTETATTQFVVKKTDAEVAASGAVIAARKSEFSQVVNFKSDSLLLALYDNGEIDGDTVSVFMNGQPLMIKQGLKASAIKKTIYISGDNEDFNLVLFADNLGKYPPNTGLLVIKDGDDIYNVRFSSDLQKSSGIVFRKKK